MFFGFSSEPSGQSGVPLHSSNEGMQLPSMQANCPAAQVLPLLLELELELLEPLLDLQFLSIGASSEPSGQSGLPLHCKDSWMQVPSLHVNWCVLQPSLGVQDGLVGASSEPSGQSRFWLHSSNEGMHVPSLHVNWSAVHGPPLEVEVEVEVEEEVAPPLLEPDDVDAEADAEAWLDPWDPVEAPVLGAPWPVLMVFSPCAQPQARARRPPATQATRRGSMHFE